MSKMKEPFRIESPISFRVSAEWLEALDRWRENQPVKPSRTAVIVTAVEQFIASPAADALASNLADNVNGTMNRRLDEDEADVSSSLPARSAAKEEAMSERKLLGAPKRAA
jgi:hypothetical protein